MTKNENKPLDVSGLPSPGALLREKRNESGKSMEQVAKALHLSLKQLRALERDDYEQLPGETYIFGYWKSYANYLDISIDESVAAYKRDLRATVADESPQTRHQLNDATMTHKRMGMWTLSLLGIFLMVAWYGKQLSTPTAQIEDITFNQAQAESEENTATEQSIEQFPKQSQEGQLAFDDEVTEEEESEEANTAAHSSQPRHAKRISFVVEEKSWLEVYDDNETSLIRRVVKRGDNLTVEGKSPFSVFIGNANGVAVEYEGELISVRPHGDSVFAHFKVGAQ